MMMPKTKTDDLEAMGLDELRARYLEVTGEATRDRSKKRLIEKIRGALEPDSAPQQAEETPAEADAEPATDAPAYEGEQKISKLSVDDLRAKHLELIGRETKSTNRRYLIWRVQQAQKGKIPTGPRAGRGNAGPTKVLPLRVPEAAVEALGEAKARLGLRSRNELLIKAVHDYLAQNGEAKAAALLTGDDAA
jgi:hypothetical protein